MPLWFNVVGIMRMNDGAYENMNDNAHVFFVYECLHLHLLS